MAKSLMVQGTMSNAGKSLLTAGILRVIKQDGYQGMPFKSQNMALNSFITDEGLEMGRAQVVQAEAAGVRPSVLMNPILLKPTNDVGSQVIVNGVSIGNMSAREYFAYKTQLIPEIMKAYNTLSERSDIIVIEGAGSPAEINLKQEDVVNMGMARLADAPVILVGDIDRGGVFAQLYGTVALLEEEERARVKGLVINKFRGDKTILDPGIEMIEKKCGIPVVGVVPYTRLDIEDEDSLSSRLETKKAKGPALIDIAVIRLPRLSNFTDFNRFESIEGVSLRYVSDVKELGQPDLIFLPGTKNTMGDLKAIRQNGLEAAILKAHANGALVFGVCGGYQMLGEEIADPHGTEEGGTMRGIGLLPMKTIFENDKTRTRVRGTFRSTSGLLAGMNGTPFEGYEIHMGISEPSGSAPAEALTNVRVARRDDIFDTGLAGRSETKVLTGTEPSEKMEGCAADRVFGTYIHGIFDNAGVVEGIVRLLAERKGLDYEQLKVPDYQAYKEQEYDKLADVIRASMDMEAIYRIIGV
ncbi:MAG: cobyric acid synthase [Lachnospiraceae bacterium]|nr:cobyric acid synthase [Lachnospiraceae bacterium]